MGHSTQSLIDQFSLLCQQMADLPLAEQITVMNAAKLALHEHSPFHNEPVDCVLWIASETIHANDYNPNNVAPPEMKLLELSIASDGYTQPIVAWHEEDGYEVVDGFHRHRIGTTSKKVRQRIQGYLPITVIRPDREGYADRVASTIRHNRARGKHQIQAMSEIVVDLSRRNHSDEWIARELGMDPDEVLRLKQISGLAEMFADQEFSEAWDVEPEPANEILPVTVIVREMKASIPHE